ncbi:MAG: ABC transporter permease [Sphingobacteriales bacterium]|nr:ABC transporter permease [Sphingobacteriales bacterium]MBI3717179.1 ABC transporter permease [Sphingobacteriales bacterium]
MIKNYLKIAWRNFTRNKTFSFINIAGLALGLATCILIMLYVQHELGYDRYNKKADRIARIYFEGNVQGQKMKESTVMAPVAQTVKTDFPEVEQATRIRVNYEKPKIICKGNVFKDDDFACVDANFFDVFTIPFIEGDKTSALTEANSVVLSEATAKKYFGKEEAMGQVITLKDGNVPYKVAGVMKDIPSNSHFHFDMLASMEGVHESKEANWMSSNFYTYIVLKNESDYEKLDAKLPQLVDKYIGPQLKQGLGQTLEEFRKSGSDISFHLQPLTAIHLYSDFQNDLSVPGNVQYVYIFGAIALFMLLIACINFMNLSTAGASKRLKEVGIRKVLGSFKKELSFQFLTESVLIAAVAFVFALAIIYAALPFFNQLTGLSLSLNFSQHPLLLPGLVTVILITGLLAGSYPAFYLSSFKPVQVLKGKFTNNKKSSGIRSSLVVFQFFISITLIVSTIVVYRQLSFIQHKDLGYDKNQVMILSNLWQLGNKQDVFRNQLENDPRVEMVSSSRYLPAGSSDNNNFFITSAQKPGDIIKTLRYEVDEKYIPTLGIKLKEGRNFSPEFKADSSAIIINEAAATALGITNQPIGQIINKNLKSGERVSFTVIGVVKDFHFRSLHEHITPLLMTLTPDKGNLIVKLKTKSPSSLAADLQKRFAAYGAEDPMEFSFLDERYNAVYNTEQKAGLILAVFAGLTIFVACLGLFGLATYTAEQRTKEIGIRKVLGASAVQVTQMLSAQFIKLVIIASLIAFPAAWWAMNKWLQGFAYRINISVWVFVAAGIAALLIALITISFRSIKAAIANPVKSLRTE